MTCPEERDKLLDNPPDILLTNYKMLDYLLTRPEVDHEKIGCAGHSGGGTLTLFISALDERVRCAVVNEGGTSHRWRNEY